MQVRALIPPMIFLGAATLAVSPSFAATQGDEGATSTGTMNLTVGVGDKVRISGLTDISGNFDGTNDIVAASPACVYRNGTGKYGIRATGSGGSGSFTLSDGANQVSYQVSYNDGSGAQPLTAGTLLAGRTGADRFSPSCATAGNNGSINVTIPAAQLAQVPGSTYAGTLTLVVTPE